MGSGLILFVIVGAWLVVLVPMGLRSHDGTPSRSAERIGDAVRVLSRRSAAPPADDLEYAEDDLADDADGPAAPWHRLAALLARRPVVSSDRFRQLSRFLLRGPVALLRVARATLGGARVALADRRASQGPATAPARRRRVLLGLLLLAVLAGSAGQVGPAWLVDIAGVALVATLLFLVSCRRQALRRADARARREALEARRRAELRRSRVVVRTPERKVSSAPLEIPEPVAVREPARPGLGAEWQPVPVPPPMYVGKPVVTRRSAPPSEPEVWEPEAADDEQGVFEPRRVVSGW